MYNNYGGQLPPLDSIRVFGVDIAPTSVMVAAGDSHPVPWPRGNYSWDGETFQPYSTAQYSTVTFQLRAWSLGLSMTHSFEISWTI